MDKGLLNEGLLLADHMCMQYSSCYVALVPVVRALSLDKNPPCIQLVKLFSVSFYVYVALLDIGPSIDSLFLVTSNLNLAQTPQIWPIIGRVGGAEGSMENTPFPIIDHKMPKKYRSCRAKSLKIFICFERLCTKKF